MARAIIIAPGDNPAMAALCERRPIPLLPFLGRPFIQHVVEFLARHKFDQYDVVLSHFPEQIEESLGNAERWGGTIRYHLALDPQRPYKPLRSMHFDEGETVILAHADRLPQMDLESIVQADGGSAPVLFHSTNQPAERAEGQTPWTGWAWIPGESLSRIPADCDEEGLAEHLMSLDGCSSAKVARQLSIRSYSDYLDSNRAVLEKEVADLLLTGREVEEGIWLSHNIVLHPTVRLTAPVYLAENCRIDAGVRLGPNVVVCEGCIIDARSMIDNSIVFPSSYVGEGLELEHAIVDKNRLINVQLNVAVPVTDDFVLGGIQANQLTRAITRLLGQLTGAVLLVVLAPLLFATALGLKLARRASVWSTREVVRLPATTDEATWRTFRLVSFLPANRGPKRESPGGLRHFFLHFLPGLISVALGRLSLVGVPPRSREEIQCLPEDWRRLYLSAKAGLVTESFVRYRAAQSTEDQYSADTVYAVTAGFRNDAKLLIGYCARVLGWHPPTRQPLEDDSDLDTEGDES